MSLRIKIMAFFLSFRVTSQPFRFTASTMVTLAKMQQPLRPRIYTAESFSQRIIPPIPLKLFKMLSIGLMKPFWKRCAP